ncbi:uncharacterized protein VTP21DRAFT_392 [Calcarisporiella thermophila]|uniref:uncharacterized protein n=1 Tax=Calcarisporiella thermophila TaxID=911321 RepID=UPI003743AFF2
MSQQLLLPDGTHLSYRVLGENTKALPLIMICGLAMSKDEWYPSCDELAKHRQVLIFDNRGINESTPIPDSSFTMEILAQDTISLANHLGWRDVGVLGFSMGGMIAQTLVTRLTGALRVQKLILVSTGPSKSICMEFFRLLFVGTDILVSSNPDPSKLDSYSRELFIIDFTPQWVAENSETIDLKYTEYFKLPRPEHVVLRQIEAAKQFDVREELPKLNIPTLILQGDCDQVMGVEDSRLMHRLIPNSRYLLLPGIGHDIFTMHPEILREVDQFLCGKEASGETL